MSLGSDPVTGYLGTSVSVWTLRSDDLDVRSLRLYTLDTVPETGRHGIPVPTDLGTLGLETERYNVSVLSTESPRPSVLEVTLPGPPVL